MSNIKIYNYNNYFNRIVKRSDTLSGYGTAVYTETNVNFIPGNEAFTVKIAGKGTSGATYTDNGNYVVEYDSNNTILSRWFIIDSQRTRSGQYELTLKRDVLAEFKSDVLDSKAFIHKGYVDYTNGLIFNSEGSVVNQIKKSEYRLYDESYSPWLYIYIKKGAPNKTLTINTGNEAKADITLNVPIGSSIYAPGTSKGWVSVTNGYVYFKRETGWLFTSWNNSWYKYNSGGGSSAGVTGLGFEPTLKLGTLNQNWNEINDALGAVYVNNFGTCSSAMIASIKAHGTGFISDSDFIAISSANKKIIKDSNGKYYRLNVTMTSVSDNNIRFENTDSAWTTLNTYFANVNLNKNNTTPDGTSFGADYSYYQLNVSTEELTNMNFTITVHTQTAYQTKDAAYNVLAIPYDAMGLIKHEDIFEPGTYTTERVYFSADRSMEIANRICAEYGTDWILDLQLLPYGPADMVVNQSGYIYFDASDSMDQTDPDHPKTDDPRWDVYYDSQLGQWRDAIYYVTTIQRTFDKSYSLTYPKYYSESAAGLQGVLNKSKNIKLANETEMVRLCSPNYNGMFEFSIAKALSISKWNVDITLKPYNPYIHIYPIFADGSVYGQDFNDARGLICGGDFSLPIISDPWINYQNQNKNYQIMFDRQIQNMDFNQRLERIQGLTNAITGTIQGGATGATAGGMAGGPYGAIAGGAVGTLASGIGGAIDYSLLKQQQTETRNYSIDMYNYQLGNIKALPYNLTKISSFNFNNKIIPFVEYYSCTDAEKNALAEKLLMNGFTIDTVGSIANYIKPTSEETFIQGELIRIDNPAIDNQMVEEINKELQEGVYF